MKTFKKSILALGLALGVMASIGVSSFAGPYPSKQEGKVGKYGTTGSSSITYNTGAAYTSYGDNGSVSVNSTYGYSNTSNYEGGSYTRSNGHYRSTSVSFTAPNNCKSVSILSSHAVSKSGQSWSAKTYAD